MHMSLFGVRQGRLRQLARFLARTESRYAERMRLALIFDLHGNELAQELAAPIDGWRQLAVSLRTTDA